MDIKFNFSLLDDYKLFEKANNGNWNILSYLNMNYKVEDALAFFKLFVPDFVLHKDCLILSFRYREAIFNQWYEESNGNQTIVEKMCNLYEIKDFFHINTSLETPFLEEKISFLSNFLQYSWQLVLESKYPNKYKVETFSLDGSRYITIYNNG